MGLQQLRERIIGFLFVVYMLFGFFQSIGPAESTSQQLEIILSQDSQPAANTGVRLLLLPHDVSESCGEDEGDAAKVVFQGVTDRLGRVELDHSMSWVTGGTRRARAANRLKVARLCTRRSEADAWRPVWTALSPDVNRRELRVTCDLQVTSARPCSHETSWDFDRSWRLVWVPVLNFLLFLCLLLVGVQEGAERAWVWLLLSAGLNQGAGWAASDQPAQGKLLVLAAVAAVVYGFVQLARVGVTPKPGFPKFSFPVRDPRNPF
jgi:hypothetical protein